LRSLELMTEEVQVWVAPLEVTDARYADLAGTLVAEERRRAEDLPPILARRFVVARGILRDLLARFTGTAPQDLRFEYGTAGKPSLTGHDINFNISHSADLGLFAFAPDRAVGVDVENERPVRRLLDVAQRFMSEEDVHTLAATHPEERDASFLRSWVVREARLKAEGKSVWSGQENPSNPPNLTHKLFSPRPGYIAAVAASDSDWRLYTCALKH
jgi:4'-phosphopantetheinyl transferase